MTTLEQEILDALNELDAAARAARQPQPKPDLQSLFSRLDQLAGRLPPQTDPNLRHFLQRKSYEKARQLLLNAPN